MGSTKVEILFTVALLVVGLIVATTELLLMIVIVLAFGLVVVTWESWPKLRPWMLGAIIVWMLSSAGYGVYSCATTPPTGPTLDDLLDDYYDYNPVRP